MLIICQLSNVNYMSNVKTGFIALISVLLISSLILIIGISVILISTREVDANKIYKDSREAWALVNSCAEIGIMRLRANFYGYEGRERIAIGGHSCNIFGVTTAPDGSRTFDARARIDRTDQRLRVNVRPDMSFSITPF